MKNKIKKPNKAETNQITLADVTIISHKNLKVCEQSITRLLKNKAIKNYLNAFEKKKMLSKIPTYIE